MLRVTAHSFFHEHHSVCISSRLNRPIRITFKPFSAPQTFISPQNHYFRTMPTSTLSLIKGAPEPETFANPPMHVINLDIVSKTSLKKLKQKQKHDDSWRGKDIERVTISQFEPMLDHEQKCVQNEEEAQILKRATQVFGASDASQDKILDVIRQMRVAKVQTSFNYNAYVAHLINRGMYMALESIIRIGALSADSQCMILHHLISVAQVSEDISEKKMVDLIELVLVRVRGVLPHVHSMRQALRKMTFAEVRCMLKVLSNKFIPSESSLFWFSCIIEVHGRELVQHEDCLRYMVSLRRDLEAHQRVCEAVTPFVGAHELVVRHRTLPTLYRDYELYHIPDTYKVLTRDDGTDGAQKRQSSTAHGHAQNGEAASTNVETPKSKDKSTKRRSSTGRNERKSKTPSKSSSGKKSKSRKDEPRTSNGNRKRHSGAKHENGGNDDTMTDE